MTELVGMTATGQPTRQACRVWLQYRAGVPGVSIAIPGLDADQCRCADCCQLNPKGVWWVDQRLRTQSLAGRRHGGRENAAPLPPAV